MIAKAHKHDQRHRPNGRTDRRDQLVVALERRRDLAARPGHPPRLAPALARDQRRAALGSRIGRGYRAADHRWRTLFVLAGTASPARPALVRRTADRSWRNVFPWSTVSKSNERS